VTSHCACAELGPRRVHRL